MTKTSAIWQHMLHIPPTKKYSSPNRSKQTNNNNPKSHTKEPTFRNMEVLGKTGQENGPKAEQDKTETAKAKAMCLATKTKEPPPPPPPPTHPPTVTVTVNTN